MAKVRRVLRKLPPNRGPTFDERLWPVNVALLVLASFLVGMSLAYLRFDDPRWYANAWTSVLGVPGVTLLVMLLLRFVGDRTVRRAVQLAAIISAIVHILLVQVALESKIFSGITKNLMARRDLVDAPPPVTIPEYAQHHFTDPQERPQQEFEKPVETETPQRAVEEVARQETQPESTPREPQPSPVPESLPTMTPNIVPKSQPGETSPRASEQASKLSRNIAPPTPQPNQTVNVPQPESPTKPEPVPLRPDAPKITRQTTAATAQPTPTRVDAPQPSNSTPVPPAAIAAAQPARDNPRVETSSTPTLPRTVAEPSVVPRTTLPAPDAPAVARQTSPEAVRPANTATAKQETTSPRATPKPPEPSPEAPALVASPTPRREFPTPSQPAAATTPIPTPSQRARMTTRPDVATVAPNLPTAPTPLSGPETPLAPQVGAVARSAPAAAAVVPRAASREGEPQAAATRADTATPLVAANNRPGPSSDQPQAAPNTSSPSPTRSTNPAIANVVTRAADVAANTAPTASAELQPATSATQVARQATNSANTNRIQTPLEQPTLGTTPQVASRVMDRAAESAVPSVDPRAPAGASPSRAARTAAVAASPTAVESPAISVSTAKPGAEASQAAKTALAKSSNGLTGAGSSANLDRSAPAPQTPALAASGAAQRAQATQNTPEGAALAPSAPAEMRRSVAGAATPSASLRAEAAENANTAGSNRPSELTASASAAITQANSNAAPGAITAAAGRVEVDLGPTQIVAEKGTGRASGGGQPEMSFEAPSTVIARDRTGGAPQASLASNQAALVPTAPAGTSGGAPRVDAVQPAATATVRSTAGGEANVSGGPTTSSKSGPTDTVATATALAATTLSRANAVDGAVGGSGRGGEPASKEEEDEEARARRLARTAVGRDAQLPAPQAVAVDGPKDGGAGTSRTEDPLQPTTIAAAMVRGNATASSAAEGGGAAAVKTVAGGESRTADLTGSVRVTRAEAVDAPQGDASPGGGTGSAGKKSAGPSLDAARPAETVSLAGLPQSSGEQSGVPLAAQGTTAGRTTGGAAGAAVTATAGAVASDQTVDAPLAALVGTAPGPRQVDRGVASAPVASATGAMANVPRVAAAPAAVPGNATPVEIPALPAEVEQADIDHLAGAASRGKMKRATGGGALTVDIAAAAGAGGLGSELTPDVGVNNRRASDESLTVQLRTTRFQRQQVGGLPSTSTAAVMPTDSFRQRAGRTQGTTPKNGSPPPQTEEAIERGLAFLARYQSPDGSWSLSSGNEEAALSSDTAATALALLAFQGAGYNHREHKYQQAVRAGLDHLLKNQRDDGDLFVPMDDESNRSVWLYSHSIAALALVEAYGMTQDPALKEPAQKAVDFIVNAQHKQRGGWRYAPGIGADTSVTGWMMMALKGGELSNLNVPPEAYQGIRHWLDEAQASPTQRYLYRYNPLAADTPAQRHGREPTRTMTSVGLLMRLYTGWRRDNADMVKGADYLLQSPPQLGTQRNPERDTYYWYYATQVMFHMGGKHWAEWNGRLHPLLTESQLKQGPLAGSWDPRFPVPDRWATHAGRLYVTTMNLLSLEVYYRHLPIYEETAR